LPPQSAHPGESRQSLRVASPVVQVLRLARSCVAKRSAEPIAQRLDDVERGQSADELVVVVVVREGADLRGEGDGRRRGSGRRSRRAPRSTGQRPNG
jgi:hypothetical protein